MNGCISGIKNSRKAVEDGFKSFMARYFSKGPRLTKVYTIEDCMIVVYCKEFLTPLEKNLINDEHGCHLMQILRERIIQNHIVEFLNIVRQNYKGNINKFYLDFNIADDSLCCVFMLE